MNDWMNKLDQLAEDSDFPVWDNANYTPGAMRALGFLAKSGWVLAFEAIVYAVRESEIQRIDYAYGPGAARAGYVGWTPLLERSDLVEDVNDFTIRSRITGVASGGDVEDDAGGAGRTFRTTVLGHAVALEVAPTKLPGVDLPEAKLRRLSPEEVFLFRMCDVVPRDDLFLPAAEIAKRTGVDGAKLLFSFDDWQHVRFDPKAMKLEAPSSSPDLVMMVEALASGHAPQALLGRPNCNYRANIEEIIALHPRTEDVMWGVAPSA